MDIFGNDQKIRGCFTRVDFGANKDGFYLDIVGKANKTKPVIVTGFSFVEAEKFMVVPCFNNVNHTYGFGHDAGSSVITVDFIGFLTEHGGLSPSNVVGTMAGIYAQNRLSVSKKQAKLYCGSGAPISGFVVRLESSTSSAETNIQGFQMQMLVVEPIGSSK